VPDQARPGPDGPTRAVEVAITFEGKPRGARVIDPTTGAVLTTLPGTWRLPRSTAERVVLVTKRGYLPRRITVVPDATRSKTVVLTKREEDGKKKFNPERIDNPFDP
jgi:hypothetical protein